MKSSVLYYDWLQGSLHVFDVSTPNAMKQMFDIHHGNFISIQILCPGSEYCVVSTAKSILLSSVFFFISIEMFGLRNSVDHLLQ